MKIFVFKNRMIGEPTNVSCLKQVIENPSKRFEHWSDIKYKDEIGNTICITKEFLDQGMTLDEVIEDYKQHASVEELESSLETI